MGLTAIYRIGAIIASKPARIGAEPGSDSTMNPSLCLLAAMVCGLVPEGTHRTRNFEVRAETLEIAKQVGDAAERHRATLAKRWLGKKLPDWTSPCRIDVTLSLERIGGLTSVSFSERQVVSIGVKVTGPLDRILNGPLPHELTHALFADHFGFQVPRWADEGGAILSEDGAQGERQNKSFQQILADERQIPLRRFLAMRDYPSDMGCLYAQGHSVSRFLVDAKGHRRFLVFIRQGMEDGWDEAVRSQFGYNSVEDLEQAWLGWVSHRRQARARPTQNNPPSAFSSTN
jgi:hypothetical protein